MRIFCSSQGDPMLMASVGQLQAIHEQINKFIGSAEAKTELAANCDGSPKPYDTLLQGLRLSKASGQSSLRISMDGWLDLEAPLSDLESFSEQFKIQEGHTHWYGSPTSLIIEVFDDRSEK